jgi:hypothetical protein
MRWSFGALARQLPINPIQQALLGEVSIAQMIGVWITNSAPELNPYGREFQFLFLLEAQAGPSTHAIYLKDYVLIFNKIKILVLILNGCVHLKSVQRPRSKILPIYKILL